MDWSVAIEINSLGQICWSQSTICEVMEKGKTRRRRNLIIVNAFYFEPAITRHQIRFSRIATNIQPSKSSSNGHIESCNFAAGYFEPSMAMQLPPRPQQLNMSALHYSRFNVIHAQGSWLTGMRTSGIRPTCDHRNHWPVLGLRRRSNSRRLSAPLERINNRIMSGWVTLVGVVTMVTPSGMEGV